MKKKLKIIYYSPHPTHDIVSEVGYATHQRETILALEKAGHTVMKVILGGTNRQKLRFVPGKAVKSKGIKGIIKKLIPQIIWITLKDLRLQIHDRKAAQWLEKEIIAHEPDLVYERSEILQSSSVKVIKKHKIPYFLEINAPFVEEMQSLEGKSLLHFLAKPKEKQKLDGANAVFAVSTALIEYLKQQYNVPSSKLHLAPNRINLENFKANHTFTSSTEFVFGFVGSILPFHNVELLIKAFEQVFKVHKHARLLIVGEGSERIKLEELSVSLKIDNLINFTGSVPHSEVSEYIHKMNVCIMPGTNWYGSPVKIFEYGAMKKPIIAPNKGPLQDVIENGKDAILVNENVEELSAAMIDVIENYKIAEERAQHFYNKIILRYCWKHAAEQIESVYYGE